MFSDGRVTPPTSSWRKQTRQVEGKLHRAEVSGRFPQSTAPLPFGDPRCFRKLEKALASCGRHSTPLPLLPSGCQILSEWLTLYKSYFYGFIFIILAGLLYLPSEFSEVSLNKMEIIGTVFMLADYGYLKKHSRICPQGCCSLFWKVPLASPISLAEARVQQPWTVSSTPVDTQGSHSQPK